MIISLKDSNKPASTTDHKTTERSQNPTQLTNKGESKESLPTFLGGEVPLDQNQRSHTFMPVIKG